MTELIKKEAPVDKKIEKPLQRVEKRVEQTRVEAKKHPVAQIAPQAPADAAAPVHDEELVIIESILSENISGIYNELSEAKKREIQKKGVEVALQIKKILRQAKIKIHDLYELIRNWLLFLPGINKFFLEQEAKIKTDKVLELKRSGQRIER